MGRVIAEQRPLYGIGTVARLSGIKPDTLRVWERRYGLGASQKNDSGRRLFTQTDLEHLQIVAKLVDRGFRIGEIAGMAGKTLSAMLELGPDVSSAPTAKPKIAFLGTNLCSWLDRHPGCLSGLDSFLLRASLTDTQLDSSFDSVQPQLLVAEAPTLGTEQTQRLADLYQRSGAVAGLVFYEFSSQANLATLAQAGFEAELLPVETIRFAAGIRRMVHLLDVGRGVGDTGELALPQPRLITDSQLQSLKNLPSGLACNCTQHLSELIQSLLSFEQYSSECSVENWRDAATHTCVYAYTNQARWLMEKALTAVLEEHESHDKAANS